MHTSLAPRSQASSRTIGDLAQGQGVGLGVDLALGERAEPAPHVADVREVDVPVDHVGDLVTDRPRREIVRDPAQRDQGSSVGLEQGERVRVGQRRWDSAS